MDLLLLATSTSQAAREALFKHLESVAERNKGIPLEEVASDVADAIREIRRRNR